MGEIKIKKPSKCTEEELNEFYKMVVEGGQVEVRGLRERIKRAAFLAFYYERKVLIGIGALKRPQESYKKKVFRRAGVPGKSGEYELELGWVYIKPEHRRRGVCSSLLHQLILMTGSKKVFATTRKDNFPMKRVLERIGFRKVGKPYKLDNDTSVLELFVRVKDRRDD